MIGRPGVRDRPVLAPRPAAMLCDCAGRTRARTCRGSAYLLVLVTVTIVTATGLSALMVQRIRVRGASMSSDAMEARNAAVSAIELGIQQMVNDPDWRTTTGGGIWLNNQPLGSGQISLKVLSPDGSALAKGSTELATLVATGIVGDARQMVELTVQETPLPLVPMEVLSYAVVVGSNLSVSSWKNVTVAGAPLASNATIILNWSSSLIGDAEAMSRSGSGTITGTATIPGTIKAMPDTSAMASYVSLATSLGSRDLEGVLLSSASNPFGAVNPSGIYLIKSFGDDVDIFDVRLLGTLIIDAGGGRVRIRDSVLLESPSPNQPVLLVIGDLQIEIDSVAGTSDLVESTVNFNPPGTPYLGQTDADYSDRYPNTIRGLIHVTGSVTISNTTELTGVLIVGSGLAIDSHCTLIHDPAIMSWPPSGYGVSPGTTTTIVSGSWKKRVD